LSVFTKRIKFQTKGRDDVTDVTSRVEDVLSESEVNSGTATVFVVGSTASVTTIEFEPGLVKDIKSSLEKILPSSVDWAHNATWGDGNGHSHLRASFIGSSLTVPIVDGGLTLGTWQQVVVIDHDNRARSREIVVQIVGE
jgi:secondary thiamine-phosphate synthase enzyme